MVSRLDIKERAHKAINLKQFEEVNQVWKVKEMNLIPPEKEQKVLRMLIRRFREDHLPEELTWLREIIWQAKFSQIVNGVNHPFCYLTVRHGIVDYEKDDEWHVDGISFKYTHLPEQDYVWCNEYPTQILNQQFTFPEDFDPSRHNVHTFIQDRIDESKIQTLNTNTLYCMDPYNIHRRDPSCNGKFRTFVRISFTPIEIDDINNTYNPGIPTKYKGDGIAFRNRLTRYKSNEQTK